MAVHSHGRPARLLALVFVTASVVTALLSLDATVVLLTPTVFATAAALRLRSTPHVYACTHLANSASLLLPISNLTNLLALAATGLGFAHFAGLMVLPWLATITVEYIVFRFYFAADLRAPGDGSRADRATALAAPAATGDAGRADRPVVAVIVVALTLIGFGVAGLFGVAPAWVAATGALVLAVHALRTRRVGPAAIARATNPAFCLFVLALGVVVRGVIDHGLGGLVGRLLPHGVGLPQLLLTAAIAAVLANLVNNLPAVLVLLPAAAAGGPALVLAVLIGVNVGPNLTYVGSLATLLWRRTLTRHDAPPDIGDFLRLGALSVPACLVAAVVTLWLGLRVIGA